MLTSNEILELIRAGYTKDEIMKMEGVEASGNSDSPAAADKEDVPAEGGKVDIETSAADPGTNKKKEASSQPFSEGSPQFDKMISKMDEMIKTMQASNRDSVNNSLKEHQADFMTAAQEFFGGKVE